MKMNIYITADRIGGPGGGSTVTREESEAFRSLGPCEVWGRDQLRQLSEVEPWCWDDFASGWVFMHQKVGFSLAHFYAGTFSKTVDLLKRLGCRISYTAAAHDIEVSKREHEKLGLPFDYSHLTDPALWAKYVAGYLAADVVICPSQHSAKIMRGYGCKNVVVIPHGCNPPAEIAPLPERFTIGYMGAVGPDKGLIYLLLAWKMLDWDDADLLIAGRDSTFVLSMLNSVGNSRNVKLLGWVDNVADFYNRISLYVQPSSSEGFGIEVLEAMSYGRDVIASDGCGAADLLQEYRRFPACDVTALASLLTQCRRKSDSGDSHRRSLKYTWPLIRQKYIDLWKEIPAGQL